MTKIFCKMCREKASSLRGLKNYSTAFVDGISGSALKTALSTEKTAMQNCCVAMQTSRCVAIIAMQFF